MSKEEKMITRRVVEGRTYNVYGGDVNGMKLLETITSKEKPNEKELKKKHNVSLIVIDCVSIKKAIYGVSVEEFMKIAKKVKEKDVDIDNEVEEKEE